MKGNERKLVEVLTIETQSLKKQYLKKTIEYSKHEFNVFTERSNWDAEQWADLLNIETEKRNGRITFESGFYNTKKSITYQRKKDEADRVVRMGLNDFLEYKKEKAVKHYQQSIEKLALRIMKKGLNTQKLKATTSHIDVNISTELTDGEQTVCAYTIIAGGPVQRPHYRYLIK